MGKRTFMILLCSTACADNPPAAIEHRPGEMSTDVTITVGQDVTVAEVWERQRLLTEAGVTSVAVSLQPRADSPKDKEEK